MAEPALTLKKIIEERDIAKITSLQATIEKKFITALHAIKRPKCGFLTKGIHGRDLFSEHHIPHHQATKLGLGLHVDKDNTKKNTGLIALKTTGDGNCLFRACSKLLSGKEELWSFLRELTSIELCLNAEYYSKHPYIEENAIIFNKRNTAFTATLSNQALGSGYNRKDDSSKIDVVQREAIRSSVPCNYASLMCIFALTSVIGREIYSLYPEEKGTESRIAQLNNGVIKPRVIHSKLRTEFNKETKLCIMWTRCGSSNFIPGIPGDFQPNHFVPIIDGPPTTTPHTGYSRKFNTDRGTVVNTKKITDFLKVKPTIMEIAKSRMNAAAETFLVTNPMTSPMTDTAKDSDAQLKRCSEPLECPIEKKKVKPDRSDSNIQDGEMDMGNIFQRKSLDDNLKLQILENHWKPGKSYPFPVRGSRKFNIKWLDRWGWLSYSKEVDGAFCVPCVLFGHQCGHNGMKLNKLYKEPLTNWQSAVTRFEYHDKNSNFHKEAMAKSINFKSIMTKKSEGIDEQCNRILNERVQNNRKILHSIVETVVLCGRQNLALRGHRDDSKYFDSPNCGNFQALLNFRVSSGDASLKSHFDSSAKNATYRSKTTQNKLVKICGDQVTETIRKEINESVFYSVLADEASDCSRKEQLALIIRYIDRENRINERFLRFIHCDNGLSGEKLAEKIVTSLKSIGLPLENCRGQGYDGAAAMSSLRKGVAGNILNQNPKAFYSHCASHRLNLCVARCCDIPAVSRAIDHAKSIANFFNFSPIRASFLSTRLRENGLKKTKLDNPSLTRWIARIASLDSFLDGHKTIVDVLEDMKYNGDKTWNSPTPGDAEALHNVCTSFDFIVVVNVVTGLLDYTMPLTRHLQERRIDVMKSLEQIDLLKKMVTSLREELDETHDKFYQKALAMAKAVDTAERVPRICKRQTNRENVESNSPSEYYKRALTIPFLDHLASELNQRFSVENCTVLNGLYIVPSVFLSCRGVSWKEKFMQFVKIYESDLPYPRQMSSEIDLWEKYWKESYSSPVPSSISESLALVDQIAFPNISVTLKILGVIPVTSCECERSISALRRLKTWLRSTMEEERLNGLALMHINNDVKIDIEKVVDVFARENRTRMRLADILNDD